MLYPLQDTPKATPLKLAQKEEEEEAEEVLSAEKMVHLLQQRRQQVDDSYSFINPVHDHGKGFWRRISSPPNVQYCTRLTPFRRNEPS